MGAKRLPLAPLHESGAQAGQSVFGEQLAEPVARRLGPAVGSIRLTGRPAIRLPAGPARWHRG
jgi:hypothetical protein